MPPAAATLAPPPKITEHGNIKQAEHRGLRRIVVVAGVTQNSGSWRDSIVTKFEQDSLTSTPCDPL